MSEVKMINKPLVIDLFCGLGGWSEAFLNVGFRAVGFDIERHDYGSGGYPGELVLRDVRSITGAELVKQYGIPAVIVASPPCQEFSYMAMPWSKAKAKRAKILADPAERVRLCDLFNQCFRIQREVSEAAGVYVPLIIENVRGAQEWVGKARWNFGSFYLWGDVPALMPIPGKMAKLPGQNLNRDAAAKWNRPILCEAEGTKQFKDFHDSPIAALGSKSRRRKKASAEIAKIPPALAAWIAKCFKPVDQIHVDNT